MKHSSSCFPWPPSPLSEKIVVRVFGVGPIPSFKNHHRIAGLKKQSDGQWLGKPKTIVRSDIRDRKQSIINAIASQLRSIAPIVEGQTIQECWKQFVTRYVPRDDCWEDLEIGGVTTELCAKGQEGATIVIERIL